MKEGERGKAIKPEFIRDQELDWLFVIDRDAAIGKIANLARELLEQDALHASRVWQKQHIVYLDPVNWYILGAGGLTSLQQSFDQLEEALQRRPRAGSDK